MTIFLQDTIRYRRNRANWRAQVAVNRRIDQMGLLALVALGLLFAKWTLG